MTSKKSTFTKQCRSILVLLGFLLLGALFAVPSLTGASAGRWQAIVKSAVCVQGPDVLLGEIAYPAGKTDDGTWETLSQIKLWKADKRAAHPVTVSRDKLKGILKYYLGDLAKNLVLPSQMTVQTGGRVLTDQQLKNRVVAFLTPKTKGLGGEVEYKNFRAPSNIFFPNKFDRLTLSSDPLKPGSNKIKMQVITSDGKVMSSRSASVFLNVWKAVPVAAKPMNRMERVTRKNVTFKRVNLAYKPGLWDGTGGPWRMARTLGRGQPFTTSHIEPVPLVERGEQVVLKYVGKRIELSIKAEALGEAGMGQQVEVRNLQSNKTILATVVADDTVVVR